MKGKTRKRIALILMTIMVLSTISGVNVSAASKAAKVTCNCKYCSLKVKVTGTLREGSKISKKSVAKVLRVTKKGKKCTYSVKQIGKTVKGSKYKLTIQKGDVKKNISVKVNRIKEIYIKQCKLTSLVEGSTFDPAIFKKKSVVMAGYKKGKDKKITTYKVSGNSKKVTANTKGEYIVTVKFGKFTDKISLPVIKKQSLPDQTVVPTKEPMVTPTVEPSKKPIVTPSMEPSQEPVVTPSKDPSQKPVVTPTVEPTQTPVVTPTVKPTQTPAVTPGTESSQTPVVTPTVEPSQSPTVSPSANPSQEPTTKPSEKPTEQVTISYQSVEGSILASKKVNIGDGFAPPTKNLWRADKTFSGWKLNNTIYFGKETDSEFYDTEKKPLSKAVEDQTAQNKDVNIIAYYVDNPVKYCSVKVIGNKTISCNNEITDAGVEAGSHVYITPDIPEGKHFGGWADKNGKIQSYEENYDFFVNSDVFLEAVFVNESIIKKPVVHFKDSQYEMFPNIGVRLHMAVEIPENYTRTDLAFLYTSKDLNEDTMVLGSVAKKVEAKSSGTGSVDWTYDLRLPQASWDAGTNVKVRVYATVQSNGVSETIYSDIISFKLVKS